MDSSGDSSLEPALRSRPPRHVRNWIALTSPAVSYALNYPVASGLPVKLAAILLAYFGLLMYNATQGTDPFTDPRRPADIAVVQLPFAIAFAQKNNILGVLSGMGYEKLNFLHRFVGRIIVVAINMHTLYYLFRYSMDGTLYFQSRTSFIAWGIVGTAAVNLLFLTSTSYVRKRAYGLFLFSHVICFIIILIAMIIHEPVTLPYFLTAAILYGADQVLRLLRTRVITASITALPHLNGRSTFVSIPGLSHGWRAGQHVRVRLVPSHGPRFLTLAYTLITARWRARPFTIATAPGTERGLELMVKAQGRSTRALYDLARAPSSPPDAEKAIEIMGSRQVTLLLEGPYSGPGHAQLASFSGAILLVAGAGITYALAHLDDITRRHATGRSHLRVLEVVWVTTDARALDALLPIFRESLRPRASPEGTLAVRVTMFYTRFSASEGKKPIASEIPLGLGMQPGRPRLGQILAETCDTVRDTCGGNPRGVAIASCGPREIAEEAHKAVKSIGWKRWRDVRGIEVVSESFSM